ncbi:MAG: acyl-CoA dehydrogenase [Sphingomonadales bacterium]|nr:acyl-CoA dehydrogenase [Sphingomonadales bacterium]
MEPVKTPKTSPKSVRVGGSFLFHTPAPADVFIREDFSEEQLMMLQATRDFMKTEVEPHLARFEESDYPLVEALMKKAGELGLLSISVPQAYGGLGMGFNTAMLVCEEISSLTGSLATAFGAHTGIGTLPVQYYGSDYILQKFLPKVASGEWISCYNLTEPNAGSDANSGKTQAVLNAAGTHYEITGQKIWISNAGFADVFIVFARIENDKNLTGFVFHKDEVTGLTLNQEEHKLGIRSSSTRQVFYDKVSIPVDQMLGPRDGGFKIAVNVLNAGRIKLGAAVLGACFKVIGFAAAYANERRQFGKPISRYGAIQQKFADMSMLAYGADSALYRAGQDIEDLQNELMASGMDEATAKLKGMEQYAVECAILKVFCSEAIALVVDEGVQIYGGMGYSADTPMEAAYRDARISRIYEGTNEINRMLIVDMLMRKAIKGELNLFGAAKKVAAELMEIPDFGATSPEGYLEDEMQVLEKLKKAVLMVAGAAAQKYQAKLADEQEILMHLADMAIEIYVLESALLRTIKLQERWGAEVCAERYGMTICLLHRAADSCNRHGREVIYALSEGDEQRMMLLGLKRFSRVEPVDLRTLRRKVAEVVLSQNKYPFAT